MIDSTETTALFWGMENACHGAQRDLPLSDLAQPFRCTPIAGADQMPSPGLAEALGAWREIPTLEDGRVMPLDTFARRHVETICH